MSAPRLPVYLRALAARLPERDREAFEDELAEMYELRRARDGEAAARRWFRRECRRAPLSLLRAAAGGAGSGRGLAGDGLAGADGVARAPGRHPLTAGADTRWRSVLRDVGFGVRALRMRPAFSSLVIATLAIGIGATATIFSLVKGILLDPLPYEASSELVALGMSFSDDPHRLAGVSVPNFRDWEARTRTLSDLAAATWLSHTLTGDAEPESVRGARVTPTFFAVLRVGASRGRLFGDEDYVPGSGVAAISHALWERRFGADPAVVGRTIETRQGTLRVVGVLPRGFSGPEGLSLDAIDVWTPLVPSEEEATRRGLRGLVVFGRLAPGVSLEAARAEFDVIATALADAFPEANSDREGRPWGVGVNPMREQTVHEIGQPLVVLLAAVGMLLLIGCVNVANLFLARGADRVRELSVRSALGAGRWRLVRQLLIESLVAAGAGGVAGVGLAYLGVAAFRRAASVEIPRLAEVGVDVGVLAFAAGLSVLTGLLFGLLPAVRATRVDPADALRGAGRSTAGAGSHRLRRGLVALEAGLALVLLTGAGLLFNSLIRMHGVERGFEAERVLAVRLTLDEPYDAEGARIGFWDELRRRVSALAGVESASAVLNVPLQGTNMRPGVVPEGTAVEDWVGIDANPIAPGYFETVGLRLLAGRDFDERDGGAGEPVIIVNQRLVRDFWPDGSAIGKRMRLSPEADAEWHTVVGVVSDHRQNGLSEPYSPMIYLPHTTMPWLPRLHLVARTSGPPAALASAIRSEIWAIDPGLPVPLVETLDERVSASVAEPTFYASLLSLFAWIALALAAIGVYGTMAYVARRRTTELGIRLALGAPSRGLRRLLVWQELRWVGVGLAAGTAAAVLSARALGGFLYGVAPTDPLTLAGSILVLGGVAAFACWLPARRATRLDPMTVLRD